MRPEPDRGEKHPAGDIPGDAGGTEARQGGWDLREGGRHEAVPAAGEGLL